jgi:hypothetical protein
MVEGTGGEIVADFVQTMNDWRRMCQHMEKMGGDRSCDICPLGGCNAIYEDDGNADYAEIGEKVATWATEHPEPVYPTWWEWLENMGIVSKAKSESSKFFDTTRMYDNISADIAQKLGIEPKS